MHYNNNFLYINGRPVGYVHDIDPAELESQGFRRISDDFKENAFEIIPASDVTPKTGKTVPQLPGRNGPGMA